MGAQLTAAQMRIAATMCDARKVELSKLSTPDEIIAGDWLFDMGVFYAGESGVAEIAKMLREKADSLERQP